jgi:type IV fimbrial biogenesis protein FimT
VAQNRKGVTLTELLVVFTVMAVMLGVGLPRFNSMVDRAGVNSARDQVLSAINLARRTAVRRAATTTFNASGNQIWVTVDSSGTQVDVMKKMELLSNYKVTLTTTGSAASIAYNSRGLASNADGTIGLTRNSKTASICITKLGAALRLACPS